MSIGTDKLRVEGAKADLAEWLSGKGIIVPAGTKLDGLVALLSNVVGSYEEPPEFSYSVEPVTGFQYGFAADGNGNYVSQNGGVDNSVAICKVTFTISREARIKIDAFCSGEPYSDYGAFSSLDDDLNGFYVNEGDGEDSTYLNGIYSFQNEEAEDEEFNWYLEKSAIVDYGMVVEGTHHIYVGYIKDSSGSDRQDLLRFSIACEFPTVERNAKVAFGSFMVDSAGTNNLTITHNLGVIPRVFLCVPYREGSAKYEYGSCYTYVWFAGSAGVFKDDAVMSVLGNANRGFITSNTKSLLDYNYTNNGDVSSATTQDITIRAAYGSSGGYWWIAENAGVTLTEFYWVAIGGIKE